jgi:hypothetical protein
MVKFFIIFLLILFSLLPNVNAQVVINELLSSNNSGIIDEDNEFSDWIELYNSSGNEVNLKGFILNDKIADTSGWVFPDIEIQPKSWLLLFASGKDRNDVTPKYQTIIKRGDTWKYFVPSSGMPENWRNTDFNDSLWASGPSGFGFGDNDDSTILNNFQTILIRKEFEIEDLNSITEMLLHVDYDDGFIAFINGNMVAMGDISSFNADYSVVQSGNHEAVMFTGGVPEQINLTNKISILRKGKNVLAIQGHNASVNSSDFSLIPFLTLSSTDYLINNVDTSLHIETGNLHTNFKISKAGESIYLFNPASELIDSSKAIALDDDVSYGRYEDGDTAWFYFEQPTPGSKNINPIENISDDSVYFNFESGIYSQPIELFMQASLSDGVIYYTTDGSVPTEESNIYSGPITVSATTVIRAAVFNENGFNNPVTTHSYIFQTPNGLPVVSISSDPKNFFDWNEGILVLGPNADPNNPNFGANFWMDWEKPINLEYFNKEGVIKVNQGAGIQVSGNWSRANAQKSLAVYARNIYGKGSFKFKFFNDRENDTFESLTLRNSGNDWLYTMMRDGLFSEIAKDMDMEREAYQPAVVYLNGEYWGILNMRERPSEHYFSENFGVDEEELNLLENDGNIIYGKNDDYIWLRNFFNSKSLLNSDNYQKVIDKMDINCFIDYELLEIYIDNGDWPGNNIKFWKTNDKFSKWRWLLFDADFGFDLYSSNGNTMVFATTTSGGGWPNPPWSTLFLRKFLVNEEFKNHFVNRFSDCLNSNLLPTSIYAKVDSIKNILEPEIQNHLNRWSFSYGDWKNRVIGLKSFASTRKTNMRNYIRAFFKFQLDYVITLSVSDNKEGRIRINTITPGSYPFKGNYFGEVPITLKAMPNPGYRFVRWEDGSTSTDLSINVNLTSNKKFNAVFEPVSENDYQVVINEINYKSGEGYDAGDWIEIYNNGNQTVDMTGWVIHDADTVNHFTFPDGQLLYPEEYLVITDNNSKFHSVYPSITNRLGEFKFGLSSSGDIIFLLDNNDALIDKVTYGVESPWPVEPFGTGATLELKNPSLNNELAENWSAGKIGGTPGSRNSVIVSAQVFAEADHQLSCFPTCFSDYTTLRFFSPGKGAYAVQILDMQGKVVETLSGLCQSGGTSYLNLFTETDRYRSGIYFVRVQTTNGVQTVKVIKK